MLIYLIKALLKKTKLAWYHCILSRVTCYLSFQPHNTEGQDGNIFVCIYNNFLQYQVIDSSSTKGDKPTTATGNIEFKGVSFTYPSRPDVKVCFLYVIKTFCNSHLIILIEQFTRFEIEISCLLIQIDISESCYLTSITIFFHWISLWINILGTVVN